MILDRIECCECGKCEDLEIRKDNNLLLCLIVPLGWTTVEDSYKESQNGKTTEKRAINFYCHECK